MAEQTIVTTKPTVEDTPAAAPSTGGFAPQISTHPVATLTLGRQTFNDSDKSNYFEG
ncbi:hypothetical protein ACH4LN_32255 [Streptomyces albus]|uniref:hypothetical protein n=1 Tax=Streptomyces TaxID=1883 RepID=UPI000AB9138B|nr:MULTISPECIES: hypothetical protein [Streptomyces]QID34266.1 hypothetical protein G3260_000015 [Streptomyces albus]QID39815.1 hypothetical protein G3260_006768 [Streptomyces albus]UVN53072.1 hypothetical protein NR995_00070 [Streptomyces albus]UVN58859.1 hypothetical protein NR995_33170 [Streptomyces albus]GHJ19111.1 hypothetical protein TPA0909_07250 [Streptomyces albus]